MLSASFAVSSVPTHHFTVHLVVAANRQGLPRPRINEALWPKHVKFNLKVVPDASARARPRPCHTYGIAEAYDQVKPKDVVFFMHAHDTSWHAPVPMQQQILRLLNLDYLYSEPFGGMYCFDNDVWAAKNLVFGPDAHMPVPDLWSLMFDGTRWAQETPSITGLQYPCCVTFFVHGEMLLQHPPDDYRKVEQNLIKIASARGAVPAQVSDADGAPHGGLMAPDARQRLACAAPTVLPVKGAAVVQLSQRRW